MRKFVVIWAGLVLVLSMSNGARANLLTDPGFDSSAVQELTWGGSPWWGGGGGGTASGGGGWITDGAAQSPSHSGTLFVYGGDWAYSVLGQTLSGGITPGSTYLASASLLRQADLLDGSALIQIEWLNGGGVGIFTNETSAFNNTYGAGSWHTISNEFTAPVGAAGAKYQVIFSKPTAADPADIWIDDAAFGEVVPEPTSALLVGLGLLAITGHRAVRRCRR
ncbi:MAG: PEP-CTERM sorting domain-containing protein [Verrucomicrobiota bacterium]